MVDDTSRTLSRTEQNYAQIEKELLAIVLACKKFDQLLADHSKITVKTDHKPSLNIFKKPRLKAPKRLQLLLMILPWYHLEAEFVKGKDNVVAETIFRAPSETNSKIEETSKQGHIFEIQVRKEIEKVEIEKSL